MNYNQLRRPCVYGLHVNGQYFYVGKTTTNVQTRWWEHRGRARSGHGAPVYEYMRTVGIDNCSIEELDTNTDNEAAWIKRLLDEGHPIQNALGRNGVSNTHSEESKKKIGAKNAGKATWIKGKTGKSAGWDEERRRAQSERIANLNRQRRSRDDEA